MRSDPTWSAGPPNTAPDTGLHEQFARTARTHPDAIALIEDGTATSYWELDATADAWAAELVAAGVRPGALVLVLFPRSVALVTALLAVLKSGAAYSLPAPDWPEQRIRDVLGDLNSPLLVAPAGTAAPAGSEVPIWSPPVGKVAAPSGFQPASVSADDPCCVFFTSGTTGRPKGVLSPHRATARLFQPKGFARFAADTTMPLAAATPWDAFSLELWSVLLNGGTSVIVTEPYLSAAALSEAVARHGTDTVWLTSSLFNMIVDEAPEAFRGLHQVMVGGERLSTPHVRAFLRGHPGTVLLNGYGPVESTVFATTHRVAEADCDRPHGVPLGRPVPGTQVYVLDGTRACAVDEVGEICLAGDGLALGYLNDPTLTEEKFQRRLVEGRRVRVYRTGDLGCWDRDGLLHYRGRADRQVKIRGHRVEPAEVERQVERLLPDVRHCRVVVRDCVAGDGRELAAFCVPTRTGDPLDGALPVLRDALVAYQRPAAVVSVDAFPVTAQGKLDERALLTMAPQLFAPPDVMPKTAESNGAPAAEPLDPLAQTVADAFAAVTGHDTVPLDMPFTRLGGTSLGAGRLCARLEASLARPVPVSWVYQHPTVTDLARKLAAAPPPPASPTATDPAAVPLSPMQVVYLTRQLVSPEDRTGHCLLTWVIEGELDWDALEAAIAALHDRHEALRAAYRLDLRPTAHPVGISPPPLETLPAQEAVEAALHAARDWLSAELAVDEGEVWATVLVPVENVTNGAGRAAAIAVFGCVVHHVAFDGWSEGVLANDLATAYNTAVRTGAAELAPQPSLAEVYDRRNARLRQAGPAIHHARLRAELADAPPIRWPAKTREHELERERERRSPGRVQVTIPTAALTAIDDMAAGAGVTRFVVLLALWGRSLAELTGQRDFVVGVPVAQRDGEELRHAIGCHITMLCLRLRGAALDGGEDAVRAVARITERAFAAQEVPLPEVLSLVDPPDPGNGRPRLYQTLFAYQDNAPPRFDLHAATATFRRQPYLDVPLELHAELWPEEDGELRLEVSFRPDAVAESSSREVTKLFAEQVSIIASGVPS